MLLFGAAVRRADGYFPLLSLAPLAARTLLVVPTQGLLAAVLAHQIATNFQKKRGGGTLDYPQGRDTSFHVIVNNLPTTRCC